MATQNLYVGDGSTVLYSFTFPYIDETDVQVSLDGTDTTAYSLANATTVEFVTAPTNGVAIRIYRRTTIDKLKATFYPGSAIRAQDLNDNFEQNLFVVQEAAFDNSNSAADSAAALATAKTADIKADQANVQSAAAEASAAQAQIEATQAAADAAQAQADATSAAADATAAQISADQANTAVQAAAIFTPIANVAAIPAVPSDQDRVSVLDSTGLESFTPLSGLPVGPLYNSGSYVNLVYQAAQTTWEFVAYGANDPDARYLLDTADSVSTSNVQNDAITTDKIVDDAVTPAKLDRAYVEKAGDTMTGTLTAPIVKATDHMEGVYESHGFIIQGLTIMDIFDISLPAWCNKIEVDLQDWFSKASSQSYIQLLSGSSAFTINSTGSRNYLTWGGGFSGSVANPIDSQNQAIIYGIAAEVASGGSFVINMADEYNPGGNTWRGNFTGSGVYTAGATISGWTHSGQWLAAGTSRPNVLRIGSNNPSVGVACIGRVRLYA